MSTLPTRLPCLPDVAQETQSQHFATLDWVGMSGIQMPLRIAAGRGECQTLATTQAYVNLSNPQSKGIHMSRLYVALDDYLQQTAITATGLKTLLQQFLHSHQTLSDFATCQLDFDYSLRRKSLKSDNTGWKAYPVSIRVHLDRQDQFQCELVLKVPYSSTCPCSAALSRQLIQAHFLQHFSDQTDVSVSDMADWLKQESAIIATPHAQRSIAEIKVRFDQAIQLPQDFALEKLIDTVENAVKTPVQSVVKREDEQEFARLNGTNLMFCEDAARRIQHHLNQLDNCADYWLRVNHLESLHPHDAVAIVTKGIVNGYQPTLS